MNAEEQIEQLRDALSKCLPIVENRAHEVADKAQHNPQWKDCFEGYLKLVREIRVLLGKDV